jgi:hypothetical protein
VGPARRRTHDAADQHRRELPRLADPAIGKLGAVKLKDLTARQVQEALAELSASLSTRSLRPPLLSTRLTRSLGDLAGTLPIPAPRSTPSRPMPAIPMAWAPE